MILAFILAMMGLLMPTWSQLGEHEGMVPLLKRHEIQVLLKAGFAIAEVAERAQVSSATVRRVQGEDSVAHVDDKAAHAARSIGRPSKAAPLASRIRGWLEEEPDLPTLELLAEAATTSSSLARRGSTAHAARTAARSRRASRRSPTSDRGSATDVCTRCSVAKASAPIASSSIAFTASRGSQSVVAVAASSA